MDHPAHDDIDDAHGLDEASANSVDAWMESRAAGGADSDHRFQQMMTAIAGPEPDAADAEVLADLVLVRVRRAEESIDRVPPILHELDAAAVDALVMSGGRLDRVPSDLRSRGERVVRVAEAITGADASFGSSADAAHRVFAAIRDDEQIRQDRMSLGPARARPSIRLADLGAVAASLLIGGAVLWPSVSAARHFGQRAVCESHMRAAAGGFGMYGMDYAGLLPVGAVARGDGSWHRVGESPESSNSASLFLLPKHGYTTVNDLACPGNPDAVLIARQRGAQDWERLPEVSYSYRVLLGPTRSSPETVLLADRSPIMLAVSQGRAVRIAANSPNHGGRGQRVLFGDGSSRWMSTPVFEDGDNLWLPGVVEHAIERAVQRRRGPMAAPIEGTERPEGAEDAFVGP
ncbi:MAG: hypothetical protein AAGG07_03750 [Planctomycetota bacterium]